MHVTVSCAVGYMPSGLSSLCVVRAQDPWKITFVYFCFT